MQQLYAHTSFVDHSHQETASQFPTASIILVAATLLALFFVRKLKKKS